MSQDGYLYMKKQRLEIKEALECSGGPNTDADSEQVLIVTLVTNSKKMIDYD